MKKVLLKYHLRLGDVLRVLAMARSLDEQGFSVYVECLPEYHSIFKICPYAMPVSPDQKPPKGFKFDYVLDLEIWPTRFHEFKKSGKKWWDFVTGLHPLLTGLKWRSPFVEPIPNVIDGAGQYVLIANTGYSQVPKIDPVKVIDLAQKLYPNLQPVCVGNNQFGAKNSSWIASDLCHLAGFVKNAGALVTINTAVTYMADALRDSYDHIIEVGMNGQNDFFSTKQTRHSL